MPEPLQLIHFSNANSRETYFSMHNVKEAHKFGKGGGIKVGIIDWCFGLNRHPGLYSGGADLSGNDFFLTEKSEHGYWMACALKEIAPCCKIYAINYLNGENFDTRVSYIEKAVMWAVENSMDIITFSSHAFSNDERLIIDKAIDAAVAEGIIPTFIHYGYEKNFYPSGLFGSAYEQRTPDIRILHYDYNTLFISNYEKYINMNIPDIKSGNDAPYFSISSLSPVLAGFVAILKSIDRSLTADDCKKILRETSYTTTFTGYTAFDRNIYVTNVADIGKAAGYVYRNIAKETGFC